MHRVLLAIACTIASLISFSASHAQTVHEVDFDTTFPSFGYSYDFSGYGNPNPEIGGNVDSSDQVSSSFDVATPPAAKGTLDTSAWNVPAGVPYTYAGWGLGIGIFLPEGQRPTTGVLADYSVSFDASVTGYVEGDDGLQTDVRILIQTPDNDDENTGAQQHAIGTEGNNIGSLPAPLLLTETPQTITLNFGDLVDFGGDMVFATSFAEVFQLLLQLQPGTNAGEIGIDADNVLTLDNVRFTGPFASDVGLEGDYDFDEDVDGDDYLVWQRGESPNALDPADLATWQTNFGLPAAGAAFSAVPEPACLLLTGIAAVALLAVRRRANPV
jgi:hypothetical protein